MIQAVAGNESVPGVVVGVGIRRADTTRSRRASGRSTTSAGRSPSTSAASTEQGLQGAVRLLHRLLAGSRRQAVAGAHRQLAAADSGASAHPPSRVSRRHRQVRRDGGRRAADHAVVLREPVDGRARGVGARAAGARQRQVRRAERAVHAQQRGAVSTKRCGEFVETLEAIEQNRWLAGGAGTKRAAVLPRSLRLAGHRAEVSRHVRAAVRRRRRPRRPSMPLPGSALPGRRSGASRAPGRLARATAGAQRARPLGRTPARPAHGGRSPAEPTRR